MTRQKGEVLPPHNGIGRTQESRVSAPPSSNPQTPLLSQSWEITQAEGNKEFVNKGIFTYFKLGQPVTAQTTEFSPSSAAPHH